MPIATHAERVLLHADADPEWRERLRNVFESVLGMHIEHAENGHIALEMMREQAPRLLVTDVDLPLIDGVTLARHVRTEEPNVAIVALATQVSAEIRTQLDELEVPLLDKKNSWKEQLLQRIEDLGRRA